jgi:ketosteroid isomerase-like protein
MPSWIMIPTPFRFALLALFPPGAILGAQVPARGRAADSASIRAAIERGARGFERAQPDSILAHYARDIVLSYPGIPDQDYATLARGYGELRDRPATVRATTTPTFDEILVDGNLAVVRVRWTTTIRTAATGAAAAIESTRYLRDLQVWRREANGEWRFFRGMHYRDSTAAPDRR